MQNILKNKKKTMGTLKDGVYIPRNEFPCGSKEDFRISAMNGDSNCHRQRPSYSQRLIEKDPTVCNGCVYNNNGKGHNNGLFR